MYVLYRGTHDGLRHVTEAICKGGENSILECDLKNDTFTSCTKHHNLIVECCEYAHANLQQKYIYIYMRLILYRLIKQLHLLLIYTYGHNNNN